VSITWEKNKIKKRTATAIPLSIACLKTNENLDKFINNIFLLPCLSPAQKQNEKERLLLLP
jgi:hypothetical protein